MEDFNFILPTEISFTYNGKEKIFEQCRALGASRILLVTDRGIEGLPIFKGTTVYLEESGLRCSVYSDVEANPKDYNVSACAKMMRKEKVEAVIAFGGGSPIDCAKAAVASLAHPGWEIRELGQLSSDAVSAAYNIGDAPPPDYIPLIAVPTTAGTGSEVTFSSVITDTQEQFKFTIKSPRIAPKFAVLDPSFTVSMPPLLTAATGMDALTHTIEAYTAKNATPLSDAYALSAIEYIHTYLVSAWKNGEDVKAREGMLLGSVMAGIAFSHSDVGGVHCIAEAMGSLYDTPHGICNAVVLPAVMKYNMTFCTLRYSRIAEVMGFSFSSTEEGARTACRRVEELIRETGLPAFRTLGVKEENLEEISEKSANNGSNLHNPRPMKAEDYMTVLKKLLGGRENHRDRAELKT